MRSLRLVLLGYRGGLRNAGLRLLAITAAVSAAVIAWNQPEAAASTSLMLASLYARIFGIAACLNASAIAIRDLDPKTGGIFRSKPVDGAHWVLLNWATTLLVWVTLLGVALGGGMAGRLAQGDFASIGMYSLGFARAASVLTVLMTLSFALSRLFRSPLGAVIAVFVWFCAMAGARFLPEMAQPEFMQNRELFWSLAAAVLAPTALIVERGRRGELRQPLPALGLVALLIGGVLLGSVRAESRYAKVGEAAATIWDQMGMQHIELGKRVPGFWLPDGRGGTVRTAAFPGKILLIYLFTAEDLEAGRVLTALDRVRKKYGDSGVQPIGVCLSLDHGDGYALANTSGLGFPIGADLSTRKAGTPPVSAMADAYNAQILPYLAVTDRRHIVRHLGSDARPSDGELDRLIQQRLMEEPE